MNWLWFWQLVALMAWLAFLVAFVKSVESGKKGGSS